MARFRGLAVWIATVFGVFGCGAQPVEPASTDAAPHGEPPPPLDGRPFPAGVSFTRWRPALEGYVPSVQRTNQLTLNGARTPFATYLNQVHMRIHPIFADRFLAQFDILPSSDPMNRADLHVMLEIVLESQQGRIHRMGVTAPSGVTAFDVMALEAVDRSQPFGPPPRAIVSSDGLVYFHWEFHRGPEACGTWNARPYLLRSAANTAPTAP